MKRGSLLLHFFSLTLAAMTLVLPQLAQVSAATAAEPAKLMCYDKVTQELRRSDVVTGCTKTESSLGSKPLEFPTVRPTSLNTYLYTRFLAAQAEARKEKISLRITSGYRSFSRQAYLFRQAVAKYGSEAEASKWVLPPEVSHHTWGMALDINYPNDRKSTLWLARNGYKYGLCRAYVNEWWHFEGLTVPGIRCPARLPNASTTKIK
jgi:D-alanyl-D-alanine carboxypeptidase